MGVFTRFLTVAFLRILIHAIFRFSVDDISYQFTAFPFLFTVLVDGETCGSKRTHHDPLVYRPFLFIALRFAMVLKEKERKMNLLTAVEGSGCHQFFMCLVHDNKVKTTVKQTAMLRQYQGLVLKPGLDHEFWEIRFSSSSRVYFWVANSISG